MFRLRTVAMSVTGTCLVLSLAGCQTLQRPLSIFRHKKCVCESAPSESTSFSQPGLQISEGQMEYTSPFVGESEPIMLQTAPVLIDGKPFYGELPEGAFLPETSGQMLPAPAPPVMSAPAPALPAPGTWVVPTPQTIQPPQQIQPAQPPQQAQPAPAPQKSEQPQASIQLPPPAYHVQAPVVHPSPPPRRARSAKAPSTLPEELKEPQLPVAPPTVVQPSEMPKPPVQEPEKRPGGLTINVTSTPGVANIGDEVRFEIRVRNQGEAPIELVELTATLSDNLQGKVIRPDGAGKFDGQKIVFEPIKPLTPMELKFEVSAVVSKIDGGNAKISVEAQSPILESGPLKNDATVSISKDDSQQD